MSVCRVADEIRRVRRLRARYDAAVQERIAALVELCDHRHVVVLCSAYRGSQYDDDSHAECRKCVDCGLEESAPFGLLLKPARRFEFGGANFHRRINATPLGKMMELSLKEVWEWVLKNGYVV